jgi:dienelactone hydrolase
MRTRCALLVAAALAGAGPAAQAPAAPRYRTLNDHLTARVYGSLAEWRPRAAYLRERVLASAGLLPAPPKTPLHAEVFGERRHDGYSVSKVFFESLPGFYVTGNLYRPAGAGPFPAILSPHGHWSYGRLENTALTSGPGRAINLARQGFVVFAYDMIGYNDSRQLTHEFGGPRESLWGLSLSGLQLWNSIRSVDFVESLPEVDRDRIGCTGESGGGTQTFLLTAVDERIKVAAPVNMISLHMQGGCLCENPPGLRLDTNNVELAALAAPRPLLMVSATGDWTNETLDVEYPAMRRLYALFDAESRVHAVQMQAPHNYNRESREAVYSWMARWLQHAPAETQVAERAFQVDPLADLLVFHGRALPPGAVTREQLTDWWIASARRQVEEADPGVRESALLHALALDRSPRPASRTNVVVMAGDDPVLQAAIEHAGFRVRPVRLTPFDEAAAAKVEHFATYNRTPASQRIADIVRTIAENPGARLVADARLGAEALLAAAAAPVGQAVIDIGAFDNSSDQALVDRLFIPGLRRAGDFQTAARMAAGRVIVHDAGDRFTLAGVRVERRQLTAPEVVAALRSAIE